MADTNIKDKPVKDIDAKTTLIDYFSITPSSYNIIKKLMQDQQEEKEITITVLYDALKLEYYINLLIKRQAAVLNSNILEKFADSSSPISLKLKLLRMSNLISETLYYNLKILFDIRNQYAHKEIVYADKETKRLSKKFKEMDTTLPLSFYRKFGAKNRFYIDMYHVVASKCMTELVLIAGNLSHKPASPKSQ